VDDSGVVENPGEEAGHALQRDLDEEGVGRQGARPPEERHEPGGCL
jgi:hypothetical protein